MNLTLAQDYLAEAGKLTSLPSGASASIAWSCPSNIALVKYWGKRQGQLPVNPSISFALREAKTNLSVECDHLPAGNGPILEYFFEGGTNSRFGDRFGIYLQEVTRYMPFLRQLRLVIRSENTFPHSSGIASSASAFGALALCLVSLERTFFGTPASARTFLRKASFLARLGSGSACRSVFGGFSLWGAVSGIDKSTDEAAMPVNNRMQPAFLSFADSILIIREGQKAVSSSEGHRMMEKHPFRNARISQANRNIEVLLAALRDGDTGAVIAVAEDEALTLHALMMTSQPGYLLMKPQTIDVLERIRRFRSETGIAVGFTLDAGANVHVLYPSIHSGQVMSFLDEELKPLTENGRIIHDGVGEGPIMGGE